MGGGLMQLVAYGAQDIYLTGNPQITFFKVVYRRHTNFSMEAIEQTLNGVPSAGGNSTVTISRNGDLVHKVYVTDSKGTNTSNSNWLSQVEIEIGGQRIDRHGKEWLDIWNELSTPESKSMGLKAMQLDIGKKSSATVSTGVTTQQIPLNFWFCRNPGLALPLIALQYHEVKLKFTWGTGWFTGCNPGVVCDYIYLDTDERRRFAQVSHEYLIEQLQYQTSQGGKSEKLNFNHPIKELIWTNTNGAPYDTAQLKLNGHDRFSPQASEYFQLRQPFDHHTAIPKQNLPSAAQVSVLDRQIEFSTFENMDEEFSQVDGAAATAATAENFHFTPATGVLNLELEGHAITDGFMAVGDQIAIVCTKAAADTAQGNLGTTYFATVTTAATSVASQVGLCNVTITPPTSADAVPLTLGGDATPGTDGKFFIFKVTNGNSSQARTSQMTKEINVYSFSLKPEEHQPSGTCKFSRIDTANLIFTGNQPASGEYIYAVNYNVLRIMSGMGGLAYSN